MGSIGMQCPPTPGPWVEGLEAEGLGLGGVDDVPEVDVEVVAEAGNLVDQGDLDVAVGVLEQLGRLGLAGALGADDGVDEAAVEGGGVDAGRLVAADDLGGVVRSEPLVARVDPLGGEGEMEVGAGLQPARLESGTNDLVGGAGIGRRLEDDGLASSEVLGDGSGCGVDRAQVGAALTISTMSALRGRRRARCRS
ncbi:hypothetical protein GCM10022199_13880 [Marihabitans asiaticum]